MYAGVSEGLMGMASGPAVAVVVVCGVAAAGAAVGVAEGSAVGCAGGCAGRGAALVVAALVVRGVCSVGKAALRGRLLKKPLCILRVMSRAHE